MAVVTNILRLPKIDGTNTSFALSNNAGWYDSMFFGAPGYGLPLTLSPCALTSGSSTIAVPSTLGLAPGMSVSAAPGISSCLIGTVVDAAHVTAVDSYGNSVLATATNAEATITFSPPPLDLSNIGFIASLRQQPGDPRIVLTVQTANGSMINNGIYGTLAFNVPLQTTLSNMPQMSLVPAGQYVMDLLAIDPTYTVNMMPEGPATVTVSEGVSDSSLLL